MSEDFNTEAVDELRDEINTLCKQFFAESEKTLNKAGARRARKISLTIAARMKEYRKISIK